MRFKAFCYSAKRVELPLDRGKARYAFSYRGLTGLYAPKTKVRIEFFRQVSGDRDFRPKALNEEVVDAYEKGGFTEFLESLKREVLRDHSAGSFRTHLRA